METLINTNSISSKQEEIISKVLPTYIPYLKHVRNKEYLYKEEVFILKAIYNQNYNTSYIYFISPTTKTIHYISTYTTTFIPKYSSFSNTFYSLNKEHRKAYHSLYYKSFTISKREKVRGEIIKICSNCKKEFKASTSPYRKFCSKNCKEESIKKYKNKIKLSTPITKICPICSKSFTTLISTQKYCSAKCRGVSSSHKQYLKKVASKALPSPKKCMYCKTEFMPSKSSQKFCSKKCKANFYYHYKIKTFTIK